MAPPFKENISKKVEIDENVLKTLVLLFGKSLHIDIIKSVALNNKWNLQKSSNILAELSDPVLRDQTFTQVKKKNRAGNNNGAKNVDVDSGADVVIEAEFDGNGNGSGKFQPSQKRYLPPSQRKNIFADKKLAHDGPVVPPKQVQNKSKRELEYERVRDLILSGTRVLVLLRGLPGSGKSHLACMLVNSTLQDDFRRFIYSTDDFFVVNGVYSFNPAQVPEAHDWNHRRVRDVMMMGVSPVIIDNTNTQMWEMRPYAHFAVEFGYAIEILEPFTPWIFNPPELARRNCHHVPKAKIVEMLERYERVTTEGLFLAYKLKYQPGKQPPQPRLYPPLRRNVPPRFSVPASLRRVQPPPQPLLQLQLQPQSQPQPQPRPQSNVAEKPAAPKKKKQRKKKAAKPSESFELVTCESMQILQSYEYSTSSESDTESSSAQLSDNGASHVPDLLSTEINECTEYVLVMPDNTLIYQKRHSDDEASAQDQAVDLITFNDSEEAAAPTPPAYSLDLINLSFNKSVDNVANQNELSNSILGSAPNEKQVSDRSGAPPIDYSSWGLTENPLISWGSQPRPADDNGKYSSPQPQRPARETEAARTYVDSSSNTCSADFNLGKREYIDASEGRFLATCNRNISEYCLLSTPKPRLVTVFDKSTMTVDDDAAGANVKPAGNAQHFSELLDLFPNAASDDLREIYEKCHRDVNWAVELLLESNMVNVSTNAAPQRPEPAAKNPPSSIAEQTEEPSKPSAAECKRSPSKFKSKHTSEENLELKRQLEEYFKIGDAHYSEHLLNLRRWKHGEAEPAPPAVASDACEPPKEGTATDDLEYESSSEEEIFELNVGMDFVGRLEEALGVGKVDYPQGFHPVLQLPASLLKQLHAYWLESVYQQMEAYSNIVEAMVREDEEFARRLQQEEAGASNEPVVPDLQEIMDMEIALAVYRADQQQWKHETPDDLATRMKKQKLFETFPTLDQNTLTEILSAYDNSFEQTMEVLMSSVGSSQIRTDKSGTQGLQKQKELIENAKKEYLEAKQSQKSREQEASATEKTEESFEEKSPNDYREEAAHHLKMRQLCYTKAQAALQKKLTQVAVYYSDMAKLHKQKYEQANSRAASAFLSAHSYNHQDSNTLDLHYLYVKEAEQALAVFLDSQISRLNDINKQKESLFIITGRGKRSWDRTSHIKPAVQRKLDERKLEYVEINPGLLKVRITRHSKMTKDLRF